MLCLLKILFRINTPYYMDIILLFLTWRNGVNCLSFIIFSTFRTLIIFVGKPTKPEIAGILKVNETSDVILTCSSNSTSRPSYYRKTVSLRYIWYRNHTVMHLETGMTLRLPKISRDVRFNKYSCQAKESIVSEKSDAIKINILCK